MAYRRRRRKRVPRNFVKISAVVVVTIAVIIAAVQVMTTGGFNAPWNSTPNERVAEALADNPSLVNFYDPLKQYFPENYMELSRGVSSLTNRGASSDEIAQYSFLAMRAFVTDHMQDIASAPTPMLVRIAKSQANVARILSRENPAACAQYGVSGLKAEMLAGLSPAARASIGAGVRATIEAAHKGAASPIMREGKLTQEDTNQLVRALGQSGLTEVQMRLLSTGGIEKASIADQCQVTLALYDTIARMPSERAARVTSSLLRKSTQQDAPPLNPPS
ncbi:MAG: hypothetical protein ABI626_06680 [Sphingomicrobium sp.]